MKNIGVLGVGIIASAVVEGFCTSTIKDDVHFFLSPRNAEKAASLKERFADQITVCGSNQEVIDSTDTIIIAMGYGAAPKSLPDLKFAEDKTIISFMSDLKRDEILQWIAPVKELIRIIPLPLVTTHEGPIIMYPGNEEIIEMFSVLGQVIPMATEDEMNVAMSITSMMSVYYQFLHTITKAAADAGLDEKVSMEFTTIFFNALNKKSVEVGVDGAQKLALDEMTPGGLNELSWTHCKDNKAFDSIREAFEKVIARMQ